MKLLSLPGFETRATNIVWCAAKGPYLIICGKFIDKID